MLQIHSQDLPPLPEKVSIKYYECKAIIENLETQGNDFRKLAEENKKPEWGWDTVLSHLNGIIISYKKFFNALNGNLLSFDKGISNFTEALAKKRIEGIDAKFHAKISEIVEFVLKYNFNSKYDNISKYVFNYWSLWSHRMKTEKLQGSFKERLERFYNFIKKSADDYADRAERITKKGGKLLASTKLPEASDRIYDALSKIEKEIKKNKSASSKTIKILNDNIKTGLEEIRNGTLPQNLQATMPDLESLIKNSFPAMRDFLKCSKNIFKNRNSSWYCSKRDEIGVKILELCTDKEFKENAAKPGTWELF